MQCGGPGMWLTLNGGNPSHGYQYRPCKALEWPLTVSGQRTHPTTHTHKSENQKIVEIEYTEFKLWQLEQLIKRRGGREEYLKQS